MKQTLGFIVKTDKLEEACSLFFFKRQTCALDGAGPTL